MAYAPNENADEEDKEDFYYSLQMTVDNVPRHDVLLLLGDLNARVGYNNKKRERVMGKHGEGELTNNAELLTYVKRISLWRTLAVASRARRRRENEWVSERDRLLRNKQVMHLDVILSKKTNCINNNK